MPQQTLEFCSNIGELAVLGEGDFCSGEITESSDALKGDGKYGEKTFSECPHINDCPTLRDIRINFPKIRN